MTHIVLEYTLDFSEKCSEASTELFCRISSTDMSELARKTGINLEHGKFELMFKFDFEKIKFAPKNSHVI